MNNDKQMAISRKKGQRARFHDYSAPGYYLITATAKKGEYSAGPLSKMPDVTHDRLKKADMIIPILTNIGTLIQKEIEYIPLYHPRLEVKRYVIMPDHIHILIHVKEKLQKTLGSELAGFLGACTRKFRELYQIEEPAIGLFEPFHDRIIFDFNQLRKSITYIEDNPRRYIIKKMYPHLFKHHLHVRIGDTEYGILGNIFLLKAIYLLPVRIHRRWSEEEFNEYDKKCLQAIEEGAVIISPAIHPREKTIMHAAISAGNCVIKLIDKPLTERTKPSGKLFDLCAEGRLLLLSPWQSGDQTIQSRYTKFHNLNDLAKAIAEMDPDMRMTILNGLQCAL